MPSTNSTARSRRSKCDSPSPQDKHSIGKCGERVKGQWKAARLETLVLRIPAFNSDALRIGELTHANAITPALVTRGCRFQLLITFVICSVLSHFATSCLQAATPAEESEPKAARLIERIDKLFADYSNATRPGGAVGVVKEGRLIYRRGFGAAHTGYEYPNTPQTLFDIASASKSFTTACVAILMDQGKLKPDDDIREIVTEMKQLPESVRIRDLLRCESGIWAQVHIMPLTGRKNVPVQHPYGREDILAILSSQRRLPFEPGSDREYSSSDFFLLALAVERISGQRFPEFAKDHLFAPCGMKRTFIEEQSELDVKNRAIGHWDHAENGHWRTWLPHAYMVGGGGLNTCIDDLFQWDQALRNHLSDDGNVLRRGRYMDEFVAEGCLLGNRFNLDAIASGLRKHGPNVPPLKYRGARRIFFTGGYWGLGACIARFPDHDFSVLCLTNNDDLSAVKLVRKIADLAIGDQLEDPSPTNVEENGDGAYVKLSKASMQKVVGAFQRQTRTIWTTWLQGDQLKFTDHLGITHDLKPISETVYHPVGKPFNATSRFEFQIGENGQAKSMIQSWRDDQGVGNSLKYRRVELADPKADLSDFSGRYLSDELNLIYAFRVNAGDLYLRVGSGHWEKLRPLTRDEFAPAILTGYDQRFFRFLRNEAGELNGLSVRFWRIRDLRFARLRP